MRRKSFDRMVCPIARALERVGEWWSLLIMRDVIHGLTRFDQLQKSLGIAPTTLSRRLDALVEAGLLARRRYSAHPPRDEYVATESGRDLEPVILMLLAWGNKHCAPEGKAVVVVDRKTGAAVDPVLTDPTTGRPVVGPDYVMAAGPAAGARTRARYAGVATARNRSKRPAPP